MKTLTLLIALSLFTFNLKAQTLVTIKPNDSKLASMQLEEKTLNKAIKKLKKIVLKSSWLKGSFSDDQSGYIFDRNKSSIGSDEGEKEYFIPSNFTILVEDISAKKAKDIKDKSDDKLEIKRLKARVDELEIDADHKKLLKKLVKKCLGE